MQPPPAFQHRRVSAQAGDQLGTVSRFWMGSIAITVTPCDFIAARHARGVFDQ
jgi:hypothetical protein